MEDEPRQFTVPPLDAATKRRRLVLNNEVEADSTNYKENGDINGSPSITEQEQYEEENRAQFQTQREEADNATDNHYNNDEAQEDNKQNEGEISQIVLSETMEANIRQIQEKMEAFTQQVSGLLEAGKNFFTEMSNEFEERIIIIHQEQMNKWQEEIELLRSIDSLNEDINGRLYDAQSLLHTVQVNSS